MIGLAQAWTLSKSWYADRLTTEWRPRTSAESQALLDGAGLGGAAWRFEPR